MPTDWHSGEHTLSGGVLVVSRQKRRMRRKMAACGGHASKMSDAVTVA